jgi:hypothetical protein
MYRRAFGGAVGEAVLLGFAPRAVETDAFVSARLANRLARLERGKDRSGAIDRRAVRILVCISIASGCGGATGQHTDPSEGDPLDPHVEATIDGFEEDTDPRSLVGSPPARVARTSPTPGTSDPALVLRAAIHFSRDSFVLRGFDAQPVMRGREVADDQYRVRAEPSDELHGAEYTLVGESGACVARALRSVVLHVEAQTRRDARMHQSAVAVEACDVHSREGESLLVAIEGAHPEARMRSAIGDPTQQWQGPRGVFEDARLPNPWSEPWIPDRLYRYPLGDRASYAYSTATRRDDRAAHAEIIQILSGDREIARFVNSPFQAWEILEVGPRSFLVMTTESGRVLFLGLDDLSQSLADWPVPMTEDYGN